MLIRAPEFKITSALGVVQILTWGSTFYLLAVLARPIATDTGWSLQAITGGVSVGLLVAGLAARPVGRVIAARGGQQVLLAGTSCLILGLGLLAVAPSLPVYYGAWCVLGLGMAGTLYEAAFSTLGVIFGAQARRAITYLTLWGGFASTICWPLTAFLEGALGWRGAVATYIALHICVTLPILWFALPHARGAPVAEAKRAAVARPPPDPRFWCLAVIGVILSLIFTMISVHLIGLLTATGYTVAAAVALGALIGPAQVGARIIELLGQTRHHPIVTQIAAAALICCGLIGLSTGFSAAVALVAYGAGTGLASIARGTVPLAVFGAQDYPAMMGKLALPMLLAAAAAPLLGAVLIARAGPWLSLLVLAGLAFVATAAALYLAFIIRRDRRAAA